MEPDSKLPDLGTIFGESEACSGPVRTTITEINTLTEPIKLQLLTIEDVFGARASIGDLVTSFDFSSVNPSDSAPGFQVGLAPAYGSLNSTSIRAMDDNLKIVLSSSLRSIASIPSGQRNWDNILSALMRNPLLIPDNCGIPIARYDMLRKSGTNAFKDGGIDQGVVHEVASWFINLIGDEDVLKSTKIDINVLGRVVGQTGVCVTSFSSLFHAEDHHRKTMVDIGVMRFPDIDRPHIQIYSIKLGAWV